MTAAQKETAASGMGQPLRKTVHCRNGAEDSYLAELVKSGDLQIEVAAKIAYANSDEGIDAMFTRVIESGAWTPAMSRPPRPDDNDRLAAARLAGKLFRWGYHPKEVFAHLRRKNAELGFPLADSILEDVTVWIGHKQLRSRRAA